MVGVVMGKTGSKDGRRSLARIECHGRKLGVRLVNSSGQTFFLHAKPFLKILEAEGEIILVKLRDADPDEAIGHHPGEIVGRAVKKPAGNGIASWFNLELFFGAPGSQLRPVPPGPAGGARRLLAGLDRADVVDTQVYNLNISETEVDAELLELLLSQMKRVKACQTGKPDTAILAFEETGRQTLPRSYFSFKGSGEGLEILLTRPGGYSFRAPAGFIRELLKRKGGFLRFQHRSLRPEGVDGGRPMGDIYCLFTDETDNPESSRLSIYLGEACRDMKFEGNTPCNFVSCESYTIKVDEVLLLKNYLERDSLNSERFEYLLWRADDLSWRLRNQ